MKQASKHVANKHVASKQACNKQAGIYQANKHQAALSCMDKYGADKTSRQQ